MQRLRCFGALASILLAPPTPWVVVCTMTDTSAFGDCGVGYPWRPDCLPLESSPNALCHAYDVFFWYQSGPRQSDPVGATCTHRTATAVVLSHPRWPRFLLRWPELPQCSVFHQCRSCRLRACDPRCQLDVMPRGSRGKLSLPYLHSLVHISTFQNCLLQNALLFTSGTLGLYISMSLYHVFFRPYYP